MLRGDDNLSVVAGRGANVRSFGSTSIRQIRALVVFALPGSPYSITITNGPGGAEHADQGGDQETAIALSRTFTKSTARPACRPRRAWEADASPPAERT